MAVRAKAQMGCSGMGDSCDGGVEDKEWLFLFTC